MLCLFAMASFTIISFFDSVLNLSPFRPVLYGVTQQSCTATSQRFANWCRGRNWKMLVKRKRTFLGQLGHQRTRTSCNEKHYRHCVRAIIYISAKLPVLSWHLHFCELESVFHQEKTHKAVVSGERQFSLCSADMWYHLCLPPLDWQQTQLKGMRAPGSKVSNIHPEAPSRSPSNESPCKRKKFFFT